jgi:sugar diacid utilization regulator
MTLHKYEQIGIYVLTGEPSNFKIYRNVVAMLALTILYKFNFTNKTQYLTLESF